MSVRRAIEALLLVVAVVCLSYYGWKTYEIHREQSRLMTEIKQDLSIPPVPPLQPIPPDGVIGELSIPRLKLTAPVKTGDDDSVLDFSVGYLPDTPLPWTPGNSAMAAHRDRLFRPLQNIKQGDEIRLATRYGDLDYRVTKTFVVDPKDVWVLKPLPHVDLTLITCYPFVYIGHAPHRFIVQAEKQLDALN